jgi:hypothetical protein
MTKVGDISKASSVGLLVVAALMLSATFAAGEDVDLPPIKIEQACGQALLGDHYYVPGALLELRRERNGDGIATQTADDHGRFWFHYVSSGRYWLYMRLPDTEVGKPYQIILSAKGDSKNCQKPIEISVCGIECPQNFIRIGKRTTQALGRKPAIVQKP